MKIQISMDHIFLIIFFLISYSFSEKPYPPKVNYVIIIPTQPTLSDSNLIWYDDFENYNNLKEKYFDVNTNNGKFHISTNDAFGSSKQSLEQQYELGQVQAGWIWYFWGDNPLIKKNGKFNEIYVRWYYKFEENFEGTPSKAARLGSFAYNDWTLAWMVHWWHDQNGNVVADVASNIEPQGIQPVNRGYNKFVRWLPIARTNFNPTDYKNRGRWIASEMHVKLNTPGKADGEYQYWIDNELVIDIKGRNIRGYWNNTTINAFQLDCYWNNGSPKKQSRFYDNLVISKQRIGLAYTSLNPTIVKTKFSDPDQNNYQTAFQAEISTDKIGTDIVWKSNIIMNESNSIIVNNINGEFLGSCLGRNSLKPGNIYYVRFRQRDNNDKWSDWGEWIAVIRTIEDTSYSNKKPNRVNKVNIDK